MIALVPSSRTTSNDRCSPSATNPVCIHDIRCHPPCRGGRARPTCQRVPALSIPETIQGIDNALTRHRSARRIFVSGEEPSGRAASEGSSHVSIRDRHGPTVVVEVVVSVLVSATLNDAFLS